MDLKNCCESPSFGLVSFLRIRVDIAQIMSRIAAELALFAGAGFLLFAANDLLVDIIYFSGASWRSLTVYSRYPRAFASGFQGRAKPGFIAILVLAWTKRR